MKNILLFGDLILDVYITGNHNRIAPEGPFPIVNINNKQTKLGCCGNVLSNISEFFDHIYLITCFNEKEINEIQQLIQNKNVTLINFHQENRHIIRKSRIYSNTICCCRFDEEEICNIDSINEDKIIKYIESIISDINIVILSDYSKGTLTKQLSLELLKLTNEYNIISLIDPKTSDLSKYKNATLLKPNKNEFKDCLTFEGISNYNDVKDIESKVMNKYNIKIVLNTLAEEGMRIFFNNSHNEFTYIDVSTIKSNVVDVVGCGDTIIASLAVYIATNHFNLKNISYESMLQCLCKVGKIAVETCGCYILNRNHWDMCYKGKETDHTVFTNGCFDIVHIGHIRLLKECKKLGNKVIIGINSDESIKQLKGDDRPINKLQNRIDFLKELNIADEIIPFEDATPIKLIKSIKPNIIVKGGDYKKEDVVGKDYVDDVVIFNLIEGYSTTNIIKNVNINS
jgi:D-beta-D-heptose 7-phosphate kinase / D-beta-D-heptose 1-phosphate adenosyltransferase